MNTAVSHKQEQVIEGLLLGVAMATLVGYLGLAWSILRAGRQVGTAETTPAEQPSPARAHLTCVRSED